MRRTNGQGRHESQGDVQGEVGSGSHQGLAYWSRVWWVAGTSGRLSNEAKRRSGFRKDHPAGLSRHEEIIGGLYRFTSHLEISTV